MNMKSFASAATASSIRIVIIYLKQIEKCSHFSDSEMCFLRTQTNQALFFPLNLARSSFYAESKPTP